MKALTNLLVLEEENLIPATSQDKKIINDHLKKHIDLEIRGMQVWSEAGIYIADLKSSLGASKEIRVNFRVDEDLKENYLQYCKQIGTSFSDDLRRYMTKCVNENGK